MDDLPDDPMRDDWKDDLIAPEGMENLQDDLDEDTRFDVDEFPISDEPELVAQLSADEIPEIPIPEPQHLASCVCAMCQELNLTEAGHITHCERCGQPFCFHFASNIDALYCVNCMSDVEVTKQTITKEYIHRNEQEKITSVYRRKAREIKIDGLDWLFAQRKIIDLSDDELDLSIEYHRNILALQIYEQELRRTARMHRYAGVHVVAPSASTEVTSSTTTTVKKTKTIKKNKKEEQLNALLKSMLGAKGMDITSIEELLKGVK